MNGMKKNRLLIQNSITYAIVIACWILVQILGATGHMTSLLKGLLVPLCIYVILAVSLNLTVGILGELSLGHAGFMCVGAFTGAFFTKCMTDVIPSVGMLLSGSPDRSCRCRRVRYHHWYSGLAVKG